MRLVIIESPFSGNLFIRWRNKIYARRAMKDSLNRGEAPFASHLLYTQVLDDNDEHQRRKGIVAGLYWGDKAELTAIYDDYKISRGMQMGIREAGLVGRNTEYRQIGKNLHWPWKKLISPRKPVITK